MIGVAPWFSLPALARAVRSRNVNAASVVSTQPLTVLGFDSMEKFEILTNVFFYGLGGWIKLQHSLGSERNHSVHTATTIPFIYSFSGNSAASAPISTFMCL